MKPLLTLTFSLLTLAVAFGQNPVKPITRINRARSTQAGGVIDFDDPVRFNGGVIGTTDITGATGDGWIISAAGITSTSGTCVICGGTSSLSWGLMSSAYAEQAYVSATASACYSFYGFGTNDTAIFLSSGLQGPAIVGWSESGSPGGIFTQRGYYSSPVVQVIRDSQPGDPAATAPLLDVDAGTETPDNIPVSQFKRCITSGDNGVLIYGDGSIGFLNGYRPTAPNPGRIYYDQTAHHWYGWNGTTWVQFDN